VLQDVERIAPCMPGATLDSVEGDNFSGRVKVKVGPIMLTYSGKASFANKDESAHSMLIQASGKETRGSGTAKATVEARMESEGDSTKVMLTTDLAVTGKPAQFGRGVMADVSGKLIDQFAQCLASEVQSGTRTGGAASAGSSSGPAADSTPAAASSAPTTSSAAATPATPATPPLPPAGAPQEAAPAPAAPAPVAAGVAGPEATSSANGQSAARQRPPQQEAIDLLGTAGMPVAKRLIAPLAAAAVLALVGWRIWARRR
jgi:carbon monoxide dehydrogenase subunit G